MAIIFLYLAKENVCGAGLFFAFCYKAHGFPFLYIVTGNIDTAYGYLKTLALGSYFTKSGNFLFNIPAFILDAVLIYLLTCLISILFRKIKIKH